MFLTETLDVKLTGFFFRGRGFLDDLISCFLGPSFLGIVPHGIGGFTPGFDSMLSQKVLIDGLVFSVEFFLFLRLIGGGGGREFRGGVICA